MSGKLTRDEEAEEIIRRLKTPPPPRLTIEKITITSKPRKLSANWTVEIDEEVEIDYDEGVIEELNQALIAQITGVSETPKIEVVNGLVKVIKDGTFLEELHQALREDKRGRSGTHY
jgi:hypothetical protein